MPASQAFRMPDDDPYEGLPVESLSASTGRSAAQSVPATRRCVGRCRCLCRPGHVQSCRRRGGERIFLERRDEDVAGLGHLAVHECPLARQERRPLHGNGERGVARPVGVDVVDRDRRGRPSHSFTNIDVVPIGVVRALVRKLGCRHPIRTPHCEPCRYCAF